jgi:hypothetical protein
MKKLKFISEQMDMIGVPYEFGEWTSEIQYPYFVGEITEEPTNTEDGLEQSTILLTGFHRGKYIDLETVKEKIKDHFPVFYGLRKQMDNGSVIVAFFDGSFYVPTGEADLKKIQINIKIKEWKGAM